MYGEVWEVILKYLGRIKRIWYEPTFAYSQRGRVGRRTVRAYLDYLNLSTSGNKWAVSLLKLLV